MRLRFLALPLLLAALAARAEPSADEARLSAGEILLETEAVPGVPLPRARVKAVIEQPPDVVWRVIEQCALYKDVFARITRSEELSREGNVVRCRTTLGMPWPFSDLTSINRSEHLATPPTYVRRWRLESGDFSRNEGSWTLTPFGPGGKRTLAVYEALSVPTTHVPSGMQEYAQKRGLPEVMVRLRAYLQRQQDARK